MTLYPRAVFAALITPAWLGSARWRELLNADPRASSRLVPSPVVVATADRAVRAFTRIPLGPWQATCLYRSVAVCLSLRWSGIDARLRLGASKTAASTRAHAWVENTSGAVLYGDRTGWSALNVSDAAATRNDRDPKWKQSLRAPWAAIRRSRPAALLMGIKLGARTPREVQARTDRYYSAAGRTSRTDYLSDDHNLRGWWSWERELVAAHLPPAGHVFVYAAGGGREVIALARAGYSVQGCECHPELVASALERLERQSLTARVHHVPASEAPAFTTTFDAIVVGWTGYAHIQGRAARIALLRSLHGMAMPAAPLILSFHTRVASSKVFSLIAASANVLRPLRSAARVEVGDTLGSYFVHMFTRDEITAELGEAGWQVVAYGNAEHGFAVAHRCV